MKILPLLGCLVAVLSIGAFSTKSAAQMADRPANKVIKESTIIPDDTLGSESSKFDGQQVLGGATRGGNLFHSFKEFSVGSEQPVFFVSGSNVVNIITRVTDARSNISGILGVTGKANLFLLNPHGISFNGGAKLEMSGTFVGSTASGLKFNDGSIFEAKATTTPLLTMSVPIGLQFGSKQQSITLKDSENLTLTNPGNLEKSYNGSSFLLVGGNIELDNSKVFLRSGKIELAAIGSNGTANIDYGKLADRQELSITVPDKLLMNDIVLKNDSTLRTTDVISGGIFLSGNNIKICGMFCDSKDTKRSVTNKDIETISRIEAEATEGSIVNSSSVVNPRGGNIELNATSEVLIDGKFSNGRKNSSGISTSLLDKSRINGGDIIISAKNLKILNGGSINNMSSQESLGIGGNIFLNIADTLELSASGNGKESEIGSNAGGLGKYGNNITIHTDRLVHKDGAQIFTDNSDGFNKNAPIGKLGDIKIVANNSVEVSGVSSKNFLYGFSKATGIASFTGGKKNAGNTPIQN